MHANINMMGLLYLRVWQLCNDVAMFAECDERVGQHYTMWMDLEGNESSYKTAAEVGKLEAVMLDTVAMHGESGSNGMRCYTGQQQGWRASDGTLWIDAELEDETFN